MALHQRSLRRARALEGYTKGLNCICAFVRVIIDHFRKASFLMFHGLGLLKKDEIKGSRGLTLLSYVSI
jgi:hypothetical protein